MNITEMIGIGQLSETFALRIEKAVNVFKKLFEEDVEHLFITNQADPENNIIYLNLWLFSKTYISEVKDFLYTDNIDVIKSDDFHYAEFNYANYDFEKATFDSKLEVIITSKYKMTMSLNATGDNCDNLFKIYKTRLKNYVLE